MEQGASEWSFLSSAKRAGDMVFSKSGRSAKLRISSGRMARPSRTRFQAASKRSSASAAAPTRISSFLDIALEVVAQLLDRLEVVAPLVVVHDTSPAQAVAQVVVQLDVEHAVARHDLFPQEQHMAWRTISQVGVKCLNAGLFQPVSPRLRPRGGRNA